MTALPTPPAVTAQTYWTTAIDGTRVRLRWYTHDGSAPGSTVVHLHGGGMIAGSTDLYEPLVRTYVGWAGVPFLSVDYRLAPEATIGVPELDAFAGLRCSANELPDYRDPELIGHKDQHQAALCPLIGFLCDYANEAP